MSTTIHLNRTTGEVWVETDNMYEDFYIADHVDGEISYDRLKDVILQEPEIFKAV